MYVWYKPQYGRKYVMIMEDYREDGKTKRRTIKSLGYLDDLEKEHPNPKDYAENFVKVLNPVAPHIAEELWEMLGHNNTIAFESWPTYDESKLIENEKEIAVQVNGKVRGTITININEDEEKIKDKAMKEENVMRHIEGKEIVKVIVIKGKIVNIVVK